MLPRLASLLRPTLTSSHRALSSTAHAIRSQRGIPSFFSAGLSSSPAASSSIFSSSDNNSNNYFTNDPPSASPSIKPQPRTIVVKSHYVPSSLSPKRKFDALGKLVNSGDQSMATDPDNVIPHTTLSRGSTSAIEIIGISPVIVGDEEVIAKLVVSAPPAPETPDRYEPEEDSYIVMTAYGAVIFFNVPDLTQALCLKIMLGGDKKATVDSNASVSVYEEHFKKKVRKPAERAKRARRSNTRRGNHEAFSSTP